MASYCRLALPTAALAGVALRFWRRPCFVLFVGSLLHVLWSLHASAEDVALVALAAALARDALAPLRFKAAWLAAGACALSLNAGAGALWVARGGGNSNFLFGANVAWAAWAALLLTASVRSVR